MIMDTGALADVNLSLPTEGIKTDEENGIQFESETSSNEKFINFQHNSSPEQINRMFESSKEEDLSEKLHKYDKLENKQKPNKENDHHSSNNNKSRRSQENSFPEILIMSFIGVFILIILLLLCVGSKSCVARFLTGRQRLKKAMQYRPSKYRTRVTPIPTENGTDGMN